MREILNKLFDYATLTTAEAQTLMFAIANGGYNQSQIASILTVFLMRNISIDEILGFRNALMELRLPVELDTPNAIDIVGTGGDGKDTFNISTSASFVVAGAGYKVVKHGNYAASSVCGASNLMEEYGVKFSTDCDTLKRSIDESNLAYLHAPLFNPAMKVVAPIRRELAVRTIFNILGPLINPASPSHNCLGVYNLSMQRLYSYILQSADCRYSVIHSLDGYDEISLTAPFKVATNSGEQIYDPSDLGFETASQSQLYGGETRGEAAKIFIDVLNGTATAAQQNSVVVNAAFAINTLDNAISIDNAIAVAKESIASGKALAQFKKFVSINS